MWWTKRPPALRIRSLNELKPGFAPRWVKLRRWTLIPSFICFFVIFVLLGVEGLFLVGLCGLVLLSIWFSFLTDPKKTLAFFGLLFRHFPRPTVWLMRFGDWLEVDLDWDEIRPQ